MITLFSNNSLGQGHTVVLNDKTETLDIYNNGELLEKIDFHNYAVFRPEHDAQFVSEKGTLWVPIRN